MTRRLTAEERELWERLGRSVKPLRKRRGEGGRKSPRAAKPEAAPPEKKPPKERARAVAARPKPPATPASPTLAPLEEKTRRRLARGLIELDARIDLHGMRQERAFDTLGAFLRQAQLRGQKIVLVITGKGALGGEHGGGRGVLRQAVPGWLARPDFRELVVGFEEAGRRHGGAGALYVRLRRRRADARAP